MVSLLTLLVSSNLRISNHIYEHMGIVKSYERKSIVEKEKNLSWKKKTNNSYLMKKDSRNSKK